MDTLEELLVEEIRDLYSAEKQLVRALPKLVKAAASDELKTAVSDHLEVTRKHVNRLEQVFGMLDEKPRAKLCKGMQGLIEEGGEAAGEKGSDALVDLAIIGAAQRVEHYEIAAYGTARAIAEHLERKEIVDLLTETLEEEAEADRGLTKVASGLYQEAEEELASAAGGE